MPDSVLSPNNGGLTDNQQWRAFEEQAAPHSYGFGNTVPETGGAFQKRDGLAGGSKSVNQSTPKVMAMARPSGIVDAFVKTCYRWHLRQEEQVNLLGYAPGDSFAEHVLSGRIRSCSRDTECRAGYVVAISLGLGALFDENLKAENAWLRHPRDQLQGKTPLQYVLEGPMANLITISGMVLHERGL